MANRIAEHKDVLLPVMVCQDGFITSHSIENIQLETSNIAFIIGGSYGLSPEIKEMSNYHLSISKMTFPHQLFRVILLEQIYRAFKIKNNESYHK